MKKEYIIPSIQIISLCTNDYTMVASSMSIRTDLKLEREDQILAPRRGGNFWDDSSDDEYDY